MMSRTVNWVRSNLEKINDPKTLNPGDKFFAIDNTPGHRPATVNVSAQEMVSRGPAAWGLPGIIYILPAERRFGEHVVPESYEFYKAGNHERIPENVVIGGKKRSKKTRKMRKSRKQTYRKRR